MGNIFSLSRSIKKEYKGSNKEGFDREYVFFPLYREISFLPTALCVKAGISANTVTAFGCLLLIASFLFLYFGCLIEGALLYLIAYIVDFVDGNIARYTKSFSAFGKTVDGFVDTLTFLLFVCLANGLVVSGKGLLPSGLELAVGVMASFIFLLRSYVHIRFAFVRASVSNKIESAEKVQRSGLFSLVKRAILAVISGMPLLLLAATLTELGSIYLVIYFIFFFILTFVELVHDLLAIRKL